MTRFKNITDFVSSENMTVFDLKTGNVTLVTASIDAYVCVRLSST